MKKLFSIFAAVLFAGSMMAGDWQEIKFTAATAAGVFNDSVFEAGDFKLTCVDTDKSKLKTTANNCVFGTSEEDKVQYEFRLQTSGKSSAKNALNLTIPADGQLRIAVRTGSSSDETRTLILTQGETELYNQVVKDVDTIVGITNPKIFKFITVDVKAGEVAVAYPINAVNFYSFAFKAADEPAEEGCAWDELPWIATNGEGADFANQFKVCVGDPAPNVVEIQKAFASEVGIYITFPSAVFGEISLPESAYDQQGAGFIFHLSAFTAKETEVSVVCQGDEYVFTVYNDKGEEAPEEVDVTIASGLIYSDYVATSGWWQIYGENDVYEISLSNSNEIEAAPGVYAAEDLDEDWSYLKTATDSINLCAGGSITLAVSEEGVVTVVGQLKGSDGKLYNLNLTCKDPVAEQTVEVNIADATLDEEYATYGLYGVFGTSAEGVYVQLGIWLDDGFAGEFTEEDLDNQYIGSGVVDGSVQNIFTATGTITPGNGEGVYKVEADILCYNNTLYKVTMQIGEDVETGVDNAAVAAKILKAIENGNVVIKKGNTKFNVGGQVIR